MLVLERYFEIKQLISILEPKLVLILVLIVQIEEIEIELSDERIELCNLPMFTFYKFIAIYLWQWFKHFDWV